MQISLRGTSVSGALCKVIGPDRHPRLNIPLFEILRLPDCEICKWHIVGPGHYEDRNDEHADPAHSRGPRQLSPPLQSISSLKGLDEGLVWSCRCCIITPGPRLHPKPAPCFSAWRHELQIKSMNLDHTSTLPVFSDYIGIAYSGNNRPFRS